MAFVVEKRRKTDTAYLSIEVDVLYGPIMLRIGGDGQKPWQVKRVSLQQLIALTLERH